MLTPAERTEIEHDLHHYPERRAACIEAMKIVQRHRGWVPDDALADIATLLDMGAAELDGVATFFNQIYRRPVGRNVILFCESISCYLLGCDAVRARLTSELGVPAGATSPDGAFTLLPTQCLGCCDRAPALMIGDDLHTHLTPEGVGPLLDAYRSRTTSRKEA